MLTRRKLLAGWAVLALAASGFPAAVRADGFTDGARKFIESLAEEAFESLTSGNVPRPERVVRFRTILSKYFDVKTIGRWVLGRYWKKATEDERIEYLELFEQLVVDTYVDRFTEYAGKNPLSVTKALVKKGSDVIVYSNIERSEGGRPVRVDWRVRARGGEFKIVDIMVEGVSMGQTQRSEFASVIRRSGGKVDGLLSELRKRAKADT